ncbi:MAG TPA: CGNR zinc finger domain-containing protein [Acidimicrobiia bacterium]|nr:CGNR zinc finger domain-containing protein [Acidimicrobiia bacterium]
MDFAHYTDDPVRLAVELVNTFGWVSRTEHLETEDDLSRLLDDSAGVWRDDFPPPRADDLPPVRSLRDDLKAVFEAPDATSAAEQINRLLARHKATPSLSTHGQSPHLHFECEDGSLTDWLAVVTAMGLATVIADEGFDRLGVCRSPDCGDVYVDTSRNRSRRHCSDTCRNRENVAAHRERRRAGA